MRSIEHNSNPRMDPVCETAPSTTSADSALSALTRLPVEVTLLVLREAAWTSSLRELRAVNSHFHSLIIENAATLLRDVWRRRKLPTSSLAPLSDGRYCQDLPDASKGFSASLGALLVLQHAVPILQDLFEEHELSHVLLATLLNHMLVSGSMEQQSARGPNETVTVVRPTAALDATTSTQIAEGYRHALQQLSLADLDMYIHGLNVVTTVVWRELCLSCFTDMAEYGPPWNMGTGRSYALEQAIVTEIVVWCGPRWSVNLLRVLGSSAPWRGRQGDGETTARAIEGIGTCAGLFVEGSSGSATIWRGLKEDAIAMASRGIGSWLWKERKRRYDAEVETHGVLALEGYPGSLGVGPL
jgi:hypothetical protein